MSETVSGFLTLIAALHFSDNQKPKYSLTGFVEDTDNFAIWKMDNGTFKNLDIFD